VLPSVRGIQRILTMVALLSTLCVSAASFGFIVSLVLQLVPDTLRTVLEWGVLCITLLLEVFRIRTLAVHRQVPQWWGHQYGPLAAALRYGLRMGVGPATILTSWFWWTGTLIGGLLSPPIAILCGLSFAFARFSTMTGLAWGKPTGVEMAGRIRTVEAWRSRSRTIAIVLVALLAAAMAARNATT
jgi:hypothetical protein